MFWLYKPSIKNCQNNPKSQIFSQQGNKSSHIYLEFGEELTLPLLVELGDVKEPLDAEHSDCEHATNDTGEFGEHEEAAAGYAKRPTLAQKVKREHGNSGRVDQIGHGQIQDEHVNGRELAHVDYAQDGQRVEQDAEDEHEREDEQKEIGPRGEGGRVEVVF